jgi:hypothetical protein
VKNKYRPGLIAKSGSALLLGFGLFLVLMAGLVLGQGPGEKQRPQEGVQTLWLILDTTMPLEEIMPALLADLDQLRTTGQLIDVEETPRVSAPGAALGLRVIARADEQVILRLGALPGVLAVSNTLPPPPPTLAGRAVQSTGSITGQVTGPGDTPLALIKVEIYDAVTYLQIGDDLTDSTGHYEVNTVTAHYDQVKIRVNPRSLDVFHNDNYVTKWYTDADYFLAAIPVNLPESDVVTNVNLSLEHGGVISGAVSFSTGSTGDLLAAGIAVEVYASDGSERIDTATESNGQFLIRGVRPGTYALRFSDPLEDRLLGSESWYHGQDSLQTANLFTVTEEMTRAINVTLTAAGFISGTVTDGDTGDPIPLASVSVRDLDNNVVNSASTDAAGVYKVGGLASGGYRVRFSKYGYLTEYYNNQPDFDNAAVVNVTAGTTTSNINAALDRSPSQSGGTVAGTITKDASQPISPTTVYVELVDPDGNFVTFDFTDPDGKYLMADVSPGIYKVLFDGEGLIDEWYNNQTSEGTADTVTVVAGMTTTVSADMISNSGCIAGTIQAGDGSPLEGSRVVRIQEADSVGVPWTFDKDTDVEGKYSACDAGSFLQGDYVVRIEEHPYIPEWYNNIYYADGDEADATPVTVTADVTTTVDATLNLGGCISGRVIDLAFGLRQPFAAIYVRDLAGERVNHYPADNTALTRFGNKADENGEFVACGLPDGTFTIQAQLNDLESELITTTVIAGQETPEVILVLPTARDIYLPVIIKD